tara:strand:+ start:750 stop:1052 length:303 start_codon:yes stop_codon:yes gene_type:complete
MGFSDDIFDAYHTIYDGIQNNRDYCQSQKKNILLAMTHLNMINFAFSGMVDPSFTGGYERAMDIALFDYNKAIRNIDYMSGDEWSNHHKYSYLEVRVKKE